MSENRGFISRWFGILNEEESKQSVLAALRRNPELTSHDLRRISYVPVGKFYVTTLRLEREGKIASRWGEPARQDGPRPRLYRLATKIANFN